MLSLLLLMLVPSAAYADAAKPVTTTDSATIAAPLVHPIIVQVSIDPPARGGSAAGCIEDGMLHLREGILKICAEGSWQPVVFSH
jgi:hypothetical protein